MHASGVDSSVVVVWDSVLPVVVAVDVLLLLGWNTVQPPP
jgi:hypothetical protein